MPRFVNIIWLLSLAFLGFQHAEGGKFNYKTFRLDPSILPVPPINGQQVVDMTEVVKVMADAVEIVGQYLRHYRKEMDVWSTADTKVDLTTVTKADIGSQIYIMCILLQTFPQLLPENVVGEEVLEDGDETEAWKLFTDWATRKVTEYIKLHPEATVGDCFFDKSHVEWRNSSLVGTTIPVVLKKLVSFVDPLDATVEYLRSNWLNNIAATVLVGFAYDGNPIAGVIHEIFFAKTQTEGGELILGRNTCGIYGGDLSGESLFAINPWPLHTNGNKMIFNITNVAPNENLRKIKGIPAGPREIALSQLFMCIPDRFVGMQNIDQGAYFGESNLTRLGGCGRRSVATWADEWVGATLTYSTYSKFWDVLAGHAISKAIGGDGMAINGDKIVYEISDDRDKYTLSGGYLGVRDATQSGNWISVVYDPWINAKKDLKVFEDAVSARTQSIVQQEVYILAKKISDSNIMNPIFFHALKHVDVFNRYPLPKEIPLVPEVAPFNGSISQQAQDWSALLVKVISGYHRSVNSLERAKDSNPISVAQAEYMKLSFEKRMTGSADIIAHVNQKQEYAATYASESSGELERKKKEATAAEKKAKTALHAIVDEVQKRNLSDSDRRKLARILASLTQEVNSFLTAAVEVTKGSMNQVKIKDSEVQKACETLKTKYREGVNAVTVF